MPSAGKKLATNRYSAVYITKGIQEDCTVYNLHNDAWSPCMTPSVHQEIDAVTGSQCVTRKAEPRVRGLDLGPGISH